jgi:hypothetical protein
MVVPTPQYAYQPSMDITLDAALTVATARMAALPLDREPQ